MKRRQLLLCLALYLNARPTHGFAVGGVRSRTARPSRPVSPSIAAVASPPATVAFLVKRHLVPSPIALFVQKQCAFWGACWRHAVHQRSSLKRKTIEDSAAGSKITLIGAAVNLFLAVFKGIAGAYGNSAAMVCDAVHSFSDLVSDGLTLVALRLGAIPPDHDHPYGHGKFESIGCLAIGSLLVLTALSFGQAAMLTLLSPTQTAPGAIALVAAVVSIVSKEGLFRATELVGRRLNSQVIVANAWHHRSDALSSVVAVFGIAGALLGWTWLDPLAGLAVASLVGLMGGQITLEALAQLTDTADPSDLAHIHATAMQVEGVLEVGEVRCRSMSSSMMIADLKVQIHGNTTVVQSRKIAEDVSSHIRAARPDIADVLVQTLPTCPLLDAKRSELVRIAPDLAM